MREENRVNKTWRLFHVDLVINNAIKKDIIDIKLMNFPITRNYNGED